MLSRLTGPLNQGIGLSPTLAAVRNLSVQMDKLLFFRSRMGREIDARRVSAL
jgi:hypothetical protein